MSSGSILDRLENARANMGIELTRLEKKARTSKLSQNELAARKRPFSSS